MLIFTHLIGAVVVVVLSLFALPTYVGVATVVGGLWGTISSLRVLRWIMEDRAPTSKERRAALRIPIRLTLIQGLLWIGGVVVFTSLALVLQPQRALGTAFSI